MINRFRLVSAIPPFHALIIALQPVFPSIAGSEGQFGANFVLGISYQPVFNGRPAPAVLSTGMLCPRRNGDRQSKATKPRHSKTRWHLKTLSNPAWLNFEVSQEVVHPDEQSISSFFMVALSERSYRTTLLLVNILLDIASRQMQSLNATAK
jgi:hypothetical protein